MASKPGAKMMCHLCVKRECGPGNPGGVPTYCVATSFHDVVEQTKTEYALPDSADIYRAASRVVTSGYGRWPRVQEAIEFAKELGLSRIGLASCMALIRELAMVGELFTGAGFEVTSVGCQVGKVQPGERGFPELEGARGGTCNPIAQAEILNSADTQLNYVLGLCLGHDILFARYSEAPVSTLIVKDRATGQNPVAALYASQYRKPLWKTYCDKDID